MNLVETRAGINQLSLNDNTLHFPNHRFPTTIPTFQRTWKKRIVFVGQVRKSKGIDLLIEMIEQAPDDTLIHIYGPIHDVQYEFLRSHPAYQGALQPGEVQETIARYDMIILPSFHSTEGYPGVIIEAFSVGVPAICTPWNALQEIVLHGHNGFITPRSDAKAFLEMIAGISDETYQRLSTQLPKRFPPAL